MFGLFKKARQVFTLSLNTLSAASWMPDKAEAFAEEGYEQNTIVFRCVDIISQAVASIPIKLMRKDRNGEKTEINNHPILDILQRPNPTQTYSDLVFALTAFKLIAGNSYLEAVSAGTDQAIEPAPAKGQQPLELWVWQPYQFSIICSSQRPMPRAFIWNTGDAAKRKVWEVDQVNGQSAIMHWKGFHPREKILGLSPIRPASYSIDQHNEASKWNKKMLENNALPPGVLSFKETMNETEFKRVKSEIRSNWQGAMNARTPIVLEGGADYKTLGISPADMDWLEGKKVSAQEISAAYGVPLQVIPIDGSQTFANYEQARLALWEDTVIPTTNRLLTLLELFLFPKYNMDPREYDLEPDLDDIPSLSPRRKEKWETANNAKFLTPNEKRDLVGYGARKEPEADQIYIESNLIPLTIGASVEEPADEFDEEPTEDDRLLGGNDD